MALKRYDDCKWSEEHFEHMRVNDECPWCGAWRVRRNGNWSMRFPTEELVRKVREHAVAHYNDGGWDVIVEAWDDEAIAKHIGKCVTVHGAIKAFSAIIDIYAGRQAWARSEGAV